MQIQYKKKTSVKIGFRVIDYYWNGMSKDRLKTTRKLGTTSYLKKATTKANSYLIYLNAMSCSSKFSYIKTHPLSFANTKLDLIFYCTSCRF